MSTINQLTGTFNAGANVPMDWDWVDENDGGPTFMSLAASSKHPGGVNALFADGSVHFIKNYGQPGHLVRAGHDRRRRSDQLRLLLKTAANRSTVVRMSFGLRARGSKLDDDRVPTGS